MLLICLDFVFCQESSVEAEERISRLNKEIKVEHDGRVTAERKIESTEQALVTLSQENTALQAKLEETQKELEETRKKLEASDASLASLKGLILELLTSVFGKLNTHLCCYFS